MIDNWSPITRRTLALGILALLLLLLANGAAWIASHTEASLGRLADARYRVERLQALQSHPVPPGRAKPVPTDSYFTAGSHQDAAARLGTAITGTASAAGITADNFAVAPADPSNPSLIQLSFRASGKEESILGFISQIEAARPLIRLRSWKIIPVAGNADLLQLEAVAAAAWSAPE